VDAELKTAPAWAAWKTSGTPFTLGIEEEVMLLQPEDWTLAQKIDQVMEVLPEHVADHVSTETHSSALELATGVHETVAGAAAELTRLRESMADHLRTIGLRAAVAGTHPFTVWQETVVTARARSQDVYGSMRELARREPTFALHVHVGVPDPEHAVRVANGLRAQVPLLLALSANSPFWQGRDTGLASARTPLFQAFPRVGIPRAFESYEEYVDAVDLLVRCQAVPEPTYLWWDVRLQPRFGTVEVRIMDAQTTVTATAALVALVQSLARLEHEEGYAADALVCAPEVLDENRFIAARDGADAFLIDPVREGRVPVRQLLEELLAAVRPHAADLDCADELEHLIRLQQRPPAKKQLEIARMQGKLPGLVKYLASAFGGVPA
jgi:glutamate---cysteine ligase / carboxylate-amine ligase